MNEVVTRILIWIILVITLILLVIAIILTLIPLSLSIFYLIRAIVLNLKGYRKERKNRFKIKTIIENGIKYRVEKNSTGVYWKYKKPEHILEPFRLHRERGPAFIGFGQKTYYKYGKKHREDGPAVEWSLFHRWFLKHKNEYWLNGKQCIDVENNNDLLIKTIIE